MRFRHRKGYGVQSPFAYNFICEIVNNHEMYYAFEKLKEERKNISTEKLRNTEKIDKLFFRLANFVQPRNAIIPIVGTDMMKYYIQNGCRSTKIYTYRNNEDLGNILNTLENIGLIYISTDIDSSAIIKKVLPTLPQSSIIIIEGIHHNHTVSEQWKQLKKNIENALTFDLYEIGLILPHKDFPSQHYIVNF